MCIPENFPHNGSTLGQSQSALNTTQQQSCYKWKVGVSHFINDFWNTTHVKAFACNYPTDEKGFDCSLLPFCHKQIAKETQERSLVRGKKSFLSLGSLICIKDNLTPGSISPGSDSCSSSSHQMNPILKTSQERVPGQSSSLEKIPGDGEPKPTVTVGRSATVAGDMKVLCCFRSIISKVL